MDLKSLWAWPQLPWRSSEKRPLAVVLEAHLIYQLSNKIMTAGFATEGQFKIQPGGAHFLQRPLPQKGQSHLLLPPSYSTCKSSHRVFFYAARHKHMLCQKEQGILSTLLRPSTEQSLYFSCQLTQLKFKCYIPNLQRQKDKTTKHRLLRFEWQRNKWNKLMQPSPY